MAEPIPLPIANGFYQSDSLPVANLECINWYPNIVQGPGLNQEVLFGTDGLEQLTTTGAIQQANRGTHVMAGIEYRVNGNALYRVNRVVVGGVDTFTTDSLGPINDVNRVWMADNGTQLLVLVPSDTLSRGYIFTENPDTFTEITDSDFLANGNPQTVKFVDGFFDLTTDSKKWIISALNDGFTYNALDFATAESDPDIIRGQVIFRNQVFIAGSETFEPFQNIGGATDGFPFQRTGLFLDKGLFAPFSLINTNQTFMFIGGGTDESPAVWALSGNDFVKISNTAVDSALNKLSDDEVSGIVAWTYARRGAYFVGFNLPDQALVYDTISQRWHQRQSLIDDDRGIPQQSGYRVSSISSVYGRILVGDRIDGRVGSLDDDVLEEYGTAIIRPVSTQPFQNNMKSFSVPEIELTTESGVGNADAPNPKMILEISKDGGKTYDQPRARAIGKIGETTKRSIWYRNGRMPRMTQFRFTLSEPVKPVIIQLTAKISGGTA